MFVTAVGGVSIRGAGLVAWLPTYAPWFKRGRGKFIARARNPGCPAAHFLTGPSIEIARP